MPKHAPLPQGPCVCATRGGTATLTAQSVGSTNNAKLVTECLSKVQRILQCYLFVSLHVIFYIHYLKWLTLY